MKFIGQYPGVLIFPILLMLAVVEILGGAPTISSRVGLFIEGILIGMGIIMVTFIITENTSGR